MPRSKDRDSIKRKFQEARKDLYYPPLKLEFSGSGASTVELDFSSTHKILVNPEVKEFLGDTALKGVFHHELDHWAKHPYDLKTVILEQSWVAELEENYDKARLIRNLYDDVVVTLDLVVNRALDEIAAVYQEVPTTSRVDNFLRLFFERVTGIDFGAEVQNNEQVEQELKKMFQIDFLDNRRIRLRKNIVDFTSIFSHLIEEVHIPFSDFGVEDFTGEELQRALKDLAKELDMEEFKKLFSRVNRWIGITQGYRLPHEFETPEIAWYVGRAQRYAVYINPLSATGSLYPGELRNFELDDSIDSYSPENSYGKILPGMAKRYIFEEFESYQEGLHDAIIIIDASGSMRDPDREVSHAVIGAFAIARNYIENGSKVGVVNFSGKNLQLPLTIDAKSIYEYLKTYQGSGTTLWLEELHQYLRENRAEDYVLITDMGFDNLEGVVNFFSDIKKRLTLIWIKGDVESDERFKEGYKAFKRKLPPSVTFVEVEKEEDIPHIAVGKAFVEVYGKSQ